MTDLLGQDIEAGSIIAYAARQGNVQVIKFAVVYEPDALFGYKQRIMVRPVEGMDSKAGVYKLRGGSNGHTETLHIRPNQVYVTDKSTLPKGMVRVLEDAYCLYIKKKAEGTRLQDQTWYQNGKKKALWRTRMESINGNNSDMLDNIEEDIRHINQF